LNSTYVPCVSLSTFVPFNGYLFVTTKITLHKNLFYDHAIVPVDVQVKIR